MRYEHWTRNGSEEIFKVKPTGEVLCCGAAANRLNEQAETIDELVETLRYIKRNLLPYESAMHKRIDDALAKVKP
jgi:hypothetical protein